MFLSRAIALKKEVLFLVVMTKKRVLSLNAMDKLLRECGARRVSDGAKEMLADVLEERARKYASEASKLAEHAGRKTVTEKDIQLATED